RAGSDADRRLQRAELLVVRLAGRQIPQASAAGWHLPLAVGRPGAVLPLPADPAVGGAVRRRHGGALAGGYSIGQRAGGADLWPTLSLDAYRHCIHEPSGRLLPRRLGRRLSL